MPIVSAKKSFVTMYLVINFHTDMMTWDRIGINSLSIWRSNQTLSHQVLLKITHNQIRNSLKQFLNE